MKRAAIVAALIACAALSACQKPAQSSVGAGSFDVQKLFTVDGCTVYRFMDDRSIYFTNCRGSASWQYNCGKGCTRNATVDTHEAEATTPDIK